MLEKLSCRGPTRWLRKVLGVRLEALSMVLGILTANQSSSGHEQDWYPSFGNETRLYELGTLVRHLIFQARIFLNPKIL